MQSNIVYLVFLLVSLFSEPLLLSQTLYPNSVVSNDLDFILSTDDDAFVRLDFIGRHDKEMPDSRNDDLFDAQTFVFQASFLGGPPLEIWCHSSFASLDLAYAYAEKLSVPLGKLPEVQRDMLSHVVIHKGDAVAFAETEGHFFVLYSDNMDERISTHDLEETVFHESVHASLQSLYETSEAWVKAQSSDAFFVTDYAERLPHLEDMPETALFAYTLMMHPGRLPADVEKWLIDHIPNRLAFFKSIYGIENALTTRDDLDLKAYFNKTNDCLVVSVPPSHSQLSITISNVSGNQLASFMLNQGLNEIEMDAYAKGVYILSSSAYRGMRLVKY